MKRISACRLDLGLFIHDRAIGHVYQRLTARIIQIDSVHCNTVCEEIGHRLSQSLKTQTSDLPPELKLLLDRLRQQDREESPSIVPSLDDMELRRMHRALSV